MTYQNAIAKLRKPETREQGLTELGKWVIDTCLLFGVKPEISFEVAGTFVRGLRYELHEPGRMQ